MISLGITVALALRLVATMPTSEPAASNAPPPSAPDQAPRSAVTYVPAPLPILTPEAQWRLRDRRLVAHTSVSGVFVGAALLASTLPWIPVWSCKDICGDANALGAGLTTMIAIPIGVAAGAALVVWSIRLASHRKTPPPGRTWLGREVGFAPTPLGLRISF